MDIHLILLFLLVLMYLIFLYILYKKVDGKKDKQNDMEWNLSVLDGKIILYSIDYKYLIELTPQTQKIHKNRSTLRNVDILDRNYNSEYRITDYNCNILRDKNNFTENYFLIVKDINSWRYNIINYIGLPKIYIYEKKEDNPYYINRDYGFYGTPIEKINKRKELDITNDIINKFVTKKTYQFPKYLVFY
jgi:hypothetical protein